MAILNIETATSVCSVSLSENGRVLFEKNSFDGPSHASLLGVFIEEVARICNPCVTVHTDYKSARADIVDAVAVSSGPGSYTGLRIGVSMAKGLCFGWNVPLLNIPTLDILAWKAIQLTGGESPDVLFCAMIDARRMEVYTAIYDCTLRKIQETEAVVVTENSFSSYLEKQKIYFFGNGAAKCKSLIHSANAIFIDDLHPLAADMAGLSEQAYSNKRFEDVAYFEPFYLKDFIATTPKNLVMSK